MSTDISVRKQRLRTLENQIRKAAEQIQKNGLEIGHDLCEIRDEELWRDECESWNQYLKEKAEELVGRSFSAAKKLIQSSEVSKRLPSQGSTSSLDLSASAFNELGRLAPHSGKEGAEKDYSRLRKSDVNRVLKKASESAKDGKPSVRDIRKAVDEDLGIDRSKKAAETKKKNAESDLPRIEDYLRDRIELIEEWTKRLAELPAEVWKSLDKSEPELAKRLATACDDLAALMRS